MEKVTSMKIFCGVKFEGSSLVAVLFEMELILSLVDDLICSRTSKS